MDNRVLIIDDTHLNISILRDILERENFEVFSSDISEGIEDLVTKVNPDVILLDIVMPILDGFEVCKILKDNEHLADIPIIMVTASTKVTEVKRALDLGAFDYIKKPFDEIEVIARINSALRLKDYQDKLKKLALKDGLTGLYNRVAFMELFNRQLNSQKRTNCGLSFVMVDIDNFKKVNDTHGHLAGDLVLKELATLLEGSIRESDIIGRYGGEEICIALSNINRENTLSLCERLRSRVEEFNFYLGDKTIKITISLGVVYKESNNNLELVEIIKKADEKLYESKNNGRNQVTI